MTLPTKCPNCRLSLPQHWSGKNDPNSKCPYCGKPLASATLAPGSPVPFSEPAAPAVPVQPAPAPRPAGGAKTILWGVGAPMPGAIAKPVPEPAPQSGPKIDQTVGGQSSAPNTLHKEPAVQPAIRQQLEQPVAAPVGAPAGGPDIDVNMDESFDAPAAQPASAPAKPAATVMFEPGPSVDTSLSNIERLASQSGDAKPDSTAAVDEPQTTSDEDASVETAYRPTPTRARTKSSPKKAPKGRRATRAEDDAEDDADQPAGSGNKTKIIVIVAVAVVALIAIAVFVLRGKEQQPVTEAPPPAEKPAPFVPPGEPAPSAEPAALAAKPAPVEVAKPVPSESPAAATKPAAVEKPTHAAKPAAAEKPKAATAEPAPAHAEVKTSSLGKPTEEDYRRANEAYQRGNTKLFQGNTAGAIADFGEALKLNPKDPASHRGLGLAYAQAGNSGEALKHLKLYLKASPKANDRAIIEKRIDQLRGQ